MKQIKTFLLTCFLTVFAFSAVLYTSCHKDKCSGVACYNGGSCSNGGCLCPTGYSGLHCELSPIIYQNNTFTPISITVGGASATIAVGGSTTFVGTYGSSVDGSVTISGAYGETITYSFTDVFPSNGNVLTIPLDVSSDYFYLEIQNNDPDDITALFSNYQFSNQLIENISIPADGHNYGIGYYSVDPSGYTKFSFDFTAGLPYTTSGIAVPNVNNASVQVTVP